ncbi:type VI secretion system Vgr family protein [Cupriavidus agavae]|uniref:Type VI secretion system secreted protein VgrG n=1 Tax=Cupriavidus agavae TaxID=1001822 RepID=A0A4Q7RT29_9BURK|nr:type VI secretion system Vgr family protein [Cupriavidus agavae]RZT36754.1 type VI secretion system secreted protein VgrG [Cupriavidus agavae]
MTDSMIARRTMADRLPRAVTGRQAYHLEVVGAGHAAETSVVSFEAEERLGEPYRVKVKLTCPGELERHDYLRHDATFRIDPGDGSEPREFSGFIFRFSKTGHTHDFCAYELELRPKVALLALTKASRIYQNQTAPQIIKAILRRHNLEPHQFAFKTRREYPEHKFRLQYQMSDWDYIRLLMEQEGLYSYFLPGQYGTVFGDVFVIADDIDHYLYKPELRVPYRETAGLEAGIETVFEIQTHVHTVPESFLVADYNPGHAYERLKAEANVARKEKGNYGQPYVYGTHHLDTAGARWEAGLRHEAAMAGQIVYEGQTNILGLRPARILRSDIELPDAPDGQVVTEVIHTGARDQAYRNTYKAIPSGRRYRLPIDEAKWPRMSGTLSGRVTSPGGYKYAYLTPQGHYVVRLDLDFDEWQKGTESVPLRLAKPFAGARQTGFHFPLLDGTEVAVAFRDGDPNKPYIAHAQHHSQHEDLIVGRDGWMSRNVIRTQSNNKLRFEDWEGREGIKLSTEHSGKTQLNMGYLVDHRVKQRGEGFELRTSGWGAIRAGRGLLVATDDREKARGMQLDMQEAMAQLGAAQTRMEQLANAASAAKADAADAKAMNRVLQDQIKDLQQAVMVLSANASIALATPESIQHCAGGNLTLSAGDSADVGVLRKFTVAAGEAISLFAQRLGIKLFANQGKVDIQAQNDAMNLAALKDLTITSTDGKLVLSAKDEVWIGAGGSYIKINGSRIENATSGDILERCASWDKASPGSQRVTASLASPAAGCAIRGEQANDANAALMRAGV